MLRMIVFERFHIMYWIMGHHMSVYTNLNIYNIASVYFVYSLMVKQLDMLDKDMGEMTLFLF